MKRLNGWQRIGIVLSTLWLPVGWIWGNKIGMSQGDYLIDAYSLCVNTMTVQEMRDCKLTFDQNYPLAIQYHWWYTVTLALVPIISAWPFAYLVRFIVRWIRRGFNPGSGTLWS
jgi:hypothetical protein